MVNVVVVCQKRCCRRMVCFGFVALCVDCSSDVLSVFVCIWLARETPPLCFGVFYDLVLVCDLIILLLLTTRVRITRAVVVRSIKKGWVGLERKAFFFALLSRLAEDFIASLSDQT